MIKNRLKRIYISRHILKDMSVKQFKAKYVGLKLGFWWVVVTPALLALSINFVFTKVFKMDFSNYAFFVLSGILPWFFLANSLSEGVTSFIGGSNLMKQGLFPYEFIPISSVCANLLNFLIGLLLMLPVFILLNYKVIFFLPFLLFLLLLYFFFVSGVSLLFAYANVFFRDLAHLLTIFLMFWFWLTPVFLPLALVDSQYKWVYSINPATPYIVSFQDILFYAKSPSPSMMLCAFFISVTVFVFSYLFFIHREKSIFKGL